MHRISLSADETNLAAPSSRATGGSILVASDGLEASAGALLMARRLADRVGSTVEMVSVLEPLNVIVPPLDEPTPPAHAGASRVEERRIRLSDLSRRMLDDAPEPPTEIVLGDVIPSLARVAREREACLVVTGRVHHGLIERAMRGETPLGLVRAARVPVLAVPSTMTRLPRCVIVAVGQGSTGARLGTIARALFGDAVAIHLVNVRPPALPRHEREVREEEDAHEAAIQRAFRTACASWKLPADISISSRILVGDPVTELLAFADAEGADLLVAGLSPRSASQRLSRGGLASRLFHATSRAMLIVPVGDPADPHAVDATTISADPAEWPELLELFNRRNERRAAWLAIDERRAGVHLLARKRPLIGVEVDARAGGLVVMLGDESDRSAHLSHRVSHPSVLAVHRHVSGRDDALVVGYYEGQMLLTFD
jgi:nucleotide-binding universal stress UspA family protein